MRPLAKALVRVRTIASWPIRSGKTRGRYLRARTRYPEAFEPLLSSLMAGQGADVRGGRLDGQPVPVSLGLLPSGPDPVGERHVRRQPPGRYIGVSPPKGKGLKPRLPWNPLGGIHRQ